MEALTHICRFSPNLYNHLENSFVNDSIYHLIEDMAPSLNETLTYCAWKDVEYPCSELFKPVFTEQGLCFAFNALNSNEIFTNE